MLRLRSRASLAVLALALAVAKPGLAGDPGPIVLDRDATRVRPSWLPGEVATRRWDWERGFFLPDDGVDATEVVRLAKDLRTLRAAVVPAVEVGETVLVLDRRTIGLGLEVAVPRAAVDVSFPIEAAPDGGWPCLRTLRPFLAGHTATREEDAARWANYRHPARTLAALDEIERAMKDLRASDDMPADLVVRRLLVDREGRVRVARTARLRAPGSLDAKERREHLRDVGARADKAVLDGVRAEVQTVRRLAETILELGLAKDLPRSEALAAMAASEVFSLAPDALTNMTAAVERTALAVRPAQLEALGTTRARFRRALAHARLQTDLEEEVFGPPK